MREGTKRIALLGSTGSIGTQALDVIAQHPDRFSAEVLTAQNNVALLAEQARAVQPNAVVIANEDKYDELRQALAAEPIKVYAGAKALAEVVQMDTVDLVLTALVGYSGVQPTLRAIEAGKPIALANKETLVAAGALVTGLAKEKGVNIYPVDSEHSAIFQCLVGEFHNPIDKLILTASGGPFRGKTRDDLAGVTAAQALKHPTWDMGAKVTIDSASLMNKGLEVMEAYWLFGVPVGKIEVVVHPQSIVHSLVQFEDRSIKAQLGVPDMRLPIQYAFSYPERPPLQVPEFSFLDYPQLTFEQPDTETFRNLALAYHALERGGNAPCVLNAANEIAVEAFLKGKVGFLQMSDILEDALATQAYLPQPDLNDLIATDRDTRTAVSEALNVSL